MKKLFLTLSLVLMLVLAFAAYDSGDNGGTTPGGDNTPHTHAYGEWETTKEASCTEEGTKVRHCACLEQETETIPAKGHSFGAWTTTLEPTCTEDGIKERVCACGETETETIPALSHTFGEWVTTKEATCIKEGTKERACFCGDKETETIPVDSTAHNYATVWTSDDTHHWHKCQNSGCTSVSSKTDHSFGEWVIDVVDTCVQAGVRHHVCVVCDKSVSETYSDASAHNYATAWTTDGNNHWLECQNSGCTSVTDKNSHAFGEWIIDTAATCMKSGTRHHVCIVCNKSVSETISATPHNYATEWTTDGTNHWHKCQNSGCTSVSGKTAHTFAGWVIDEAATCQKTGTRHHVCTVCNKSVSESYRNTNAHNYATEWATDGTNHWHKCQNSGCTSVSGKTTHTFGGWIIDTAATCAKSGTRHHVCTTCNKSVSESYSDATAHNYSSTWTTDSTHHWHKCQNSGCTSTKDKSSHTLNNGVCTVCNKVFSLGNNSYIRVNADGIKDPSGSFVLFGEYPQSIKSPEVVITSTKDSRGYYRGADGFYYAKVTATPYSNSEKFSTGERITEGAVYYFKVEPIRWRILWESSGKAYLLCDSIIESMRYDDNDNDFESSEIQSWLNGDFYQTAFSKTSQSLISPYYGNSLVFLPSLTDITNPSYGFSSSIDNEDVVRRKGVSDFACATGSFVNIYGNCGWWTSTPGERVWNVRGVHATGTISRRVQQGALIRADDFEVYDSTGVAPALVILLN